MATDLGSRGDHASLHSGWKACGCISDMAQMIYKFLTAEQEYESTQSEETLKTVVNTDFGRPYLPRASLEQRKSELLEHALKTCRSDLYQTVCFYHCNR
jgi:phage terminase large subunit GpA-like protein